MNKDTESTIKNLPAKRCLYNFRDEYYLLKDNWHQSFHRISLKSKKRKLPDLFYEPRMALIKRQRKILHGKKTLDKGSPDTFQQSLPRVRSQGSDPFICLNVLIDGLGFEVE